MTLNLSPPETDKKVISDILDTVKKSKTAFITWHARPDGDAFGGGLALYRMLRYMNIKTCVVSPTPPPVNLNFFADFSEVTTAVPDYDSDIGFILDCSDKSRLEGVSELVSRAGTIINIDHHQFNHNFGNINYIRPHSSSICELILNIALAANFDIDYEFALCIYVGILTDTNRFQEQNTTQRAHLIAAELTEKFISPFKISSLIYGSRELYTLKLISSAIQSLKISPSGKIGYIVITPEILQETGADDEDLEGIINYARNIKNVEVGLLLRRINGLDGIKISFRSKGKIDVGEIASKFGGGGHHNAAGCTIKGDFEEAQKIILETVEKELKTDADPDR